MRFLLCACLLLVPFRSALGSIQFIIDVESRGTNAVYRFVSRQRSLGDIESYLQDLRKGADQQAKELTVYVRVRGRVTPEGLSPVFVMLKRVGWRKGELLIETGGQEIHTVVRIPFEGQRIRTDTFSMGLPADPYEAYRKIEAGLTNEVPSKSAEPTPTR